MDRMAILIALIAAAAPQGAAVAPPPAIRVSGPTYSVDGQISGASATAALEWNKTLVLYQYSGKTLCLSSSARREPGPNAGFGWRVELTPLRSADGLVVRVDWQRMWDQGKPLANGLRGGSQVTLQPGRQVLLDYLGAGPVAEAAGSCDSVGMGLEVGLPPAQSTGVIEANLWLVETRADGTESSQRQTVRAAIGGSAAPFFFDDASLMTDGRAFYFFNYQPADGRLQATALPKVRVSGGLSDIRIADGRVRLNLRIEQSVVGNNGGGASGFELTAGPDDVLSYRVPRVPIDGAGTVAPQLSLRIQIKQIR
jgi:hypothetical protein